MRPDSSTTIQRPDLGTLAYEYMMDNRSFIGAQIMPIFGVPEASMDYPVIPIEALIKKRENLRRASRSAYPRADWEWTTGTFSCKEYGWEEPIDDREANLYRRFFDVEMVATEIAVGILLRDHESRVAAVLAASSNTANGSDWSTAASATPYADVQAGKTAMYAAAGVMPNALAMNKTLYDQVLATTEIRTYLQYTSPHLVLGEDARKETLARYFGVDQVLVGDSQEDTGKRGKAASLAQIWPSTEAYLLRIAGGPNLREPSVGRTFLWEADSPQSVVVESYRDEPVRSTVVRVRTDMDEAVQYAGAIRKIAALQG